MKKLKNIILVAIILMFTSIVASTELILEEPKNYKSFSAEDKRTYIWNKGILATEYTTLPEYEDIKVLGLLVSKLKKKMTHSSDFSPKKWKKAIHRRAVVAKVKYVPTNTEKYSGVYSEGAIGLLRASLTYTPDKRGVAPGLALKLFKDGEESLDASFLTGLDSQGQNYNFFEKPFSNIVPKSKKFGPKVVSFIFRRVTKKTNYLSIRHFADNGPTQIYLKAPESAQFSKIPARDIREDLMTLKQGEVVLEVFARSNEKYSDFNKMTEEKYTEFFNKSEKIGEIVLESDFVASSFGDDQLFFRHIRFEN